MWQALITDSAAEAKINELEANLAQLTKELQEETERWMRAAMDAGEPFSKSATLTEWLDGCRSGHRGEEKHCKGNRLLYILRLGHELE